MAIKPVELQVMLPKTAEVSKFHNDEQHKNLALQQQQVSSFQKKSESNMRQVYSQDRMHGLAIKEKREKEQKNDREGRKKDKKTLENSRKKDVEQIKTSTIDIRL